MRVWIDEAWSDMLPGGVDYHRAGWRGQPLTDLRDLARGRVKILELNGCGAEPAHIYDPAFTLAKAMKAMYTIIVL